MKILFISISILFIASVSAAEPVWIDVRSSAEHAADNINGDIRISHTNIVPEVASLYPDKSTQIQLYCKKGGRADKAMSALKEAGYVNVSNAGGIDDARAARDLEL